MDFDRPNFFDINRFVVGIDLNPSLPLKTRILRIIPLHRGAGVVPAHIHDFFHHPFMRQAQASAQTVYAMRFDVLIIAQFGSPGLVIPISDLGK